MLCPIFSCTNKWLNEFWSSSAQFSTGGTGLPKSFRRCSHFFFWLRQKCSHFCSHFFLPSQNVLTFFWTWKNVLKKFSAASPHLTFATNYCCFGEGSVIEPEVPQQLLYYEDFFDVNIWFLHTSFVNRVFICLWLVGIQIIYDWNVTMFVIGTSQTSAAWAILITDEYMIQAFAGIMQQLLGWQPQHNHYHADLECLEILEVCFLLPNFCCTQHRKYSWLASGYEIFVETNSFCSAVVPKERIALYSLWLAVT